MNRPAGHVHGVEHLVGSLGNLLCHLITEGNDRVGVICVDSAYKLVDLLAGSKLLLQLVGCVDYGIGLRFGYFEIKLLGSLRCVNYGSLRRDNVALLLI